MRFQKAGRGVADQGGVPEPHCSLHAQGLKISRQTQGPELSGQGLNYQGQGLKQFRTIKLLKHTSVTIQLQQYH